MHPTFRNQNLTESQPHSPVSTPAPINELPRAVLRPNTYLLLDGEWRFAEDIDKVGLTEKWQNSHKYAYTAQWPGSIESHIAQIRQDNDGISWQDSVVVWYERDFELPAREPATDNKPEMLFQLTFGACGYETQVWLNGKQLQTIEGESVHYGEYTSFSYELGEKLLQPTNRLTVRIADTMDADIPRGKQESSVYKRGGIWYQTYTGGVRSVWLEPVERNRLRSRLGVVSQLEDNLVRVNVTTRVHDPGDYILRLIISDKTDPEAGTLATSDFSLHLDFGQKNQRVVIELPNAESWSPAHPKLYRLVAQLIDSKGNIAEIDAHFGMRKVEARGCCVYLNGQATYIDGILYQPGTATYDEMRRHFYAMQKLGCNLVRVHIAGVDPRLYNLADELGLLLWVEVPSPHRSNQRSRQNHRAELDRMLALIETHPSVIIWSLYNEDWGAEDIAQNTETQQYIADTYHYMQLNHPQFLVVDNDGWHHISQEGRLKSDLLTAHLYTPDLEHWKSLLDRLVAGDLATVAYRPLVVGDPYFYRKQIPLVVSEWGGFGFANYGGPDDATDRTERIRQFKAELRAHSIGGDVYTQATNIEDERNGLIDFHTGELTVPEGLLGGR
jgi:beta-galactosidase/beta-glucuronidase